MSQNQATNNPAPDWRDLRAQERAEHRAARGGGGAWIVGGIFIVLGGLLLLQNFGFPGLDNWWALFILIPAVGSLAAAWQVFQNNGDLFSAGVIGPAVVGLILLGVTAAFLFEINVAWGLIGPIILILVGLGVLAGGLGWRH